MKSYAFAFAFTLLLISAFAADITPNQAVLQSADQYGTSCNIPSSSADLAIAIGASSITYVVEFALENLSSAQITSATVIANPTSCVGGSNVGVFVSPFEASYTFDAQQIVDQSTRSPNPPYGFNCNLAAPLDSIGSVTLTDSCQAGNNVDVTSQVKAALDASNPNLVLSFSAAIVDDEASICYSNSNFSGIECGLNVAQSSFVLSITSSSESTSAPTSAAPTSAPSTAAPTSAPSTQAPTSAPTSAPSTAAPTSTPSTQAPTSAPSTAAPTNAPSTQGPSTSAPATTEAPVSTVAPSSGPSSASPSSSPVTKAPATTAKPTGTATPGSDISGKNNAKSGAVQKSAIGGIAIFTALAVMFA
jgi:hypothetical protein